jgi:hypothetical protein
MKQLRQEEIFYEDRFLESWAGSIVTNPSTAIVELVANCWDAYATEVHITMPDQKTNKQFSITDNGKGMTKDEFDYIWRAMSYDRIAKGGGDDDATTRCNRPTSVCFRQKWQRPLC